MPGGGYICKDLKEAMDTRVQNHLVYCNRREKTTKFTFHRTLSLTLAQAHDYTLS